jgi:hypothetical protein
MRCVLLTAVVLLFAYGWASADIDAARVSLGDVPRTHTHYLSAEDAALCRAAAATGGVGSYFLNPALITRVNGASGQATLRFNVKSRNYLPDGADYLDSSDDGLLFAHAVAVKQTTPIVYGFGYSAASYRSLELAGLIGGEPYDAQFAGGLRFFEVLLGTSIGSEARGGIGVAAGIVNLNEEARVRLGDTLESANMDGIAASFAFGVVFDATDRLSIGAGHRTSAGVDVEGEWTFGDPPESRSGRSDTQSTSVLGVGLQATDGLSVHGSYVQEGWDAAVSTLSSYPELSRDIVGDAIGSVALGAEYDFPGQRITLRAGGSMVVRGEAEDVLVPEYSLGLGGVLRFVQYSVELSLVREQFELNGKSAEAINYGIYASVGYEF